MTTMVRTGAEFIRLVLQRIAFAATIAVTLALLGMTVAAALGYAPWLNLPVGYGEAFYTDAGRAIQIGMTVLAVLLCYHLPTNARIMALENSHRSFHMGMRDVARAYALSHRCDREGVFSLKGEFDSIRERIAFLRDHPDLSELEPSVLELAAQMSHVSQELAETYSDRKVARAQDFLTARQQEVETFNERLEQAKAAANEIRTWAMQVDLEESVARAQLDRMRASLVDILPELDHAQPEAPAPEPQPDARIEPIRTAEVPAYGDRVTPLPRAAE
ncbi:hypothetical protein [Ponticoccus alexandrii]|uniref:DNA repair protein n=1 Tax=Ponticoccus alexandrii TaxID=1943633 RepID=A0ABX7F9A6_9RHOB|nr:hypothetical protein [Ponticoccus alexandrii]ETA51547.1 DNA repair protein [Rhodobacteraceae bacterium PD-2]QRF66716.1 DNA repair protein [Ponticoccus alexandrii]